MSMMKLQYYLFVLFPSMALAFTTAPARLVVSQKNSFALSAWATNDQHEFSGVRKQWVTDPLSPRDVPNAAKSEEDRRRGMSMDYANDSYRSRGGGRMLPPARGGGYERRGREWDRQEYDRYDVRGGRRYDDGRYRDDDRYRVEDERRYDDFPDEERRGWRRGEWARQGRSRNQMEGDYDRGSGQYGQQYDWGRRQGMGRRDSAREVAPPRDRRRESRPARRRTTTRPRNYISTNRNYNDRNDDDMLNVWDMNLHYMVPSHIPGQVFDEMSPRERLSQDEILVVDGNVLRNKLPKYAYFRELTEIDLREYIAVYY